MLLKNFLLFILFLFANQVFAQKDSIKKFNFFGYGDIYYSYDFAQPLNNEKKSFLYNHKRNNEINANLIFLKGNYTDKNTRANLALMAGNYAQYNLKAEPTWAQFMQEANIGVKLSQKSNLWLDAGIMPSHIGFESAISGDCWTLTRSILAENSPYFETGIKLSFQNKKENLMLGFLALNGWQKVQMPDYFHKPSFGMQVNYKANQKLVLNYSNFLGTNQPDSVKALRTYHNFYAQYEGEKKLSFIAGFDLGTDKFNAKDYGIWFSPVLIVRYALSKKSIIAARGEYYQDKHQIIVNTNTINGFQVSGLSANFDYRINSKIQWRIESKIYDSKDKIFSQNNGDKNYSLTTNLTIRF
jgi:hypothetical protein